MKKIFIIFIVCICCFHFSYAEDSFSNSGVLYEGGFKDRLIQSLSSKNDQLEESIEYSEMELQKLTEVSKLYLKEKNDLQNTISYLQSSNDKLSKELVILKEREHSSGELVALFLKKNDIPTKFHLNTDNVVIIIGFYLAGAFFLFFIYKVYTFPLSIIRFIWRKSTGYDACKDSSNYKEYKKVIEKYRKKLHLFQNIEEKNKKLEFDLQTLESENQSLKAKIGKNSSGIQNKEAKKSGNTMEIKNNFGNVPHVPDNEDDEFIILNNSMNRSILDSENKPYKKKKRFNIYSKGDSKGTLFN